MNLHLLFAIMAIICFLADAAGFGGGKGVPIGLIFLTILLALP